MIRSIRILAAIASLVLAIGCGGGGKNVRVTGQLTKDGKPYTADLSGNEPETFAVDFVGTIDGDSYVFPATITSNGAFASMAPTAAAFRAASTRSRCSIRDIWAPAATALALASPRKKRRSSSNWKTTRISPSM
jgi:hypothetical protein